MRVIQGKGSGGSGGRERAYTPSLRRDRSARAGGGQRDRIPAVHGQRVGPVAADFVFYGDATVEAVEKRTAAYTKDDWSNISAKTETIYAKVIAAMDKGPADPHVQEAVAEWRQFITDHFYECTPEIFRGLGDLYITDERFTANIDNYQTGLAAFLREAMHIYCDKLDATL